jgi:hypothetical protein
LFRIISLFIESPFLAFVPAAGFLLLGVGLRRKGEIANPLLLLTACAWGAYGLYEWLVKLRILCTGECNIRIDLLVIFPVLVLLSVIALGVGLWQRGRAP